MQAIWLFLVSFFLFYEGVIAAPSTTQTSNSESFGTAVLNRRTLLKPYLSEYDEFYKNSADKQTMGRSVLNANLKKSIDDPYLIQMSDNFYQLPRRPLTTPDQRVQRIDPRVILDIFKAIIVLLFNKMYNWLFSDDSLESIGFYLGFKTETVDLINISMTELFSQQRTNFIRIDFLEQMFYYSCDIKNMTKNLKPMHGSVLVKKRFASFLITLKQYLEPTTLKLDEDYLVNVLKRNLRKIDKKTNASFGITVSSMKMRILMDPSDDKHIELIRNRQILPTIKWSVSKYVDLYSDIYDKIELINICHLKILGVVATHVFGHVYNHFELLSMLRKYGVNEEDKSAIDHFRPFLNAYMSVFLDRYFEFRGEINQQLIDALFSLMYFLDPSGQQTLDIKDVTEEEKSILNKHTPSTISMENYFNVPEENDEFDQKMRILIKAAVEELIKTFTGEDRDSWNSSLKIDYNEQSLDKKVLLQYMNTNTENAIDILEKFSSELTIDEQLYEKYELNISLPLQKL